MTRKVKWKIITLPLILAIAILLCLTFLPHSKTSAEMLLGDNQTLSVSDTYYSMSIQGYNRNNAVLEAKISEEVEVIDQKIAYVCYDWSSVSHLKISMQRSSNTDPNFNFWVMNFACHICKRKIYLKIFTILMAKNSVTLSFILLQLRHQCRLSHTISTKKKE